MESKRSRSRPFRLDEMPINEYCRTSAWEIRQLLFYVDYPLIVEATDPPLLQPMV